MQLIFTQQAYCRTAALSSNSGIATLLAQSRQVYTLQFDLPVGGFLYRSQFKCIIGLLLFHLLNNIQILFYNGTSGGTAKMDPHFVLQQLGNSTNKHVTIHKTNALDQLIHRSRYLISSLQYYSPEHIIMSDYLVGSLYFLF